MMMKSALCVCVALLLPCCVLSIRWYPTVPHRRSPGLTLHEDPQRNLLDLSLNQLLLRRGGEPRPAPRRAQQGSRFSLSLDVPTSILSVLIDRAKDQDLRTKAAANAELMARIGRRK